MLPGVIVEVHNLHRNPELTPRSRGATLEHVQHTMNTAVARYQLIQLKGLTHKGKTCRVQGNERD
jgi:hypothetical protein